MFFKVLLFVTLVSTVAALQSNLTLLEGKLTQADVAKTPANFLKLISMVIYRTSPSARATATFVTGRKLLTVAGFLYDKVYGKTEIETSKRVQAHFLLIRVSYSSQLVDVVKIHNRETGDHEEYRKEPAILEVKDQSSFLKGGFPGISTSPPELKSTANIYGLNLRLKNHEFLVRTFQSTIMTKKDCDWLGRKKQVGEDKSICAIPEANSKTKVAKYMDKGMPILTDANIDGMFREFAGLLGGKYLFVSIAGHHKWINSILKGADAENEVTETEDDHTGDDQAEDDEAEDDEAEDGKAPVSEDEEQ